MTSARPRARRPRARRAATLGLPLAALLASPAPALAHNAAEPAPRLPGVLLAFQLDPLALALLAASAVAYLYGVRRVAALHPRNRWRPARTAAFMAGLGALALALLSPIATYDGTYFSVHMVQHLLLTMVAAPLLLLGTPVSLVVRAVGRRGHRQVMAVLHSWPVRLLSNPLIAWAGFAAVMVGSHFSHLYEAALESEAVHVGEHLLYLVAALLFWWPVVGLDPSRWRLPHPVRLLYLFMMGPVNTFVALAIYSSGRVLYPHYLGHLGQAGALDDQHLGGAIMWVAGDLLFLVALILGVADWMRHEDKVTARIDAELAAQRAARAAAAARAEPPADAAAAPEEGAGGAGAGGAVRR